MALPDGATAIYAERVRLATLDVNGFPAVGSNTFTTDTMIKAVLTPQMQTGVDVVQENAAGNIINMYKHGDMPKYYKVQLDFATQDPTLENMIMGGVVLTDSSTALSTPGVITATPGSSGLLAAGTYYYGVTAVNQYGQTTMSAVVSATTTGSTGSVALSVPAVTGAVWYAWYGRTQGAEQQITLTTTNSWTDTGALTPNGAQPTSNTTAGPGNDTGFQSPALGVVGNPNGISIELWARAVKGSRQESYLPYYRYVIPLACNFQPDARTFQANFLEGTFSGEVFENPNWGSGPFGDWQFDSSKCWQVTRAGRETMPAVGLSPVAATS